MKSLLGLLSLLLIVVVAQIQCTLPIEKFCGDIKCPDHTFCSPIDHSCRPCVQACDSTSKNYDHARCESGCQDFIHDSIYLRRNESMSTNYGDLVTVKQDLESVKQILYVLIAITTLTLVLGIAYICSGHLSRCLHSRQKKKQKIVLPIIYDNKYGKQKESMENMENKDNNNKRRSIRLEREPSESTLPEYAYDNPNLSHSPVHHV